MHNKHKRDNTDGFLRETRNVCQHFKTKCQYNKTSKDFGTAIFFWHTVCLISGVTLRCYKDYK